MIPSLEIELLEAHIIDAIITQRILGSDQLTVSYYIPPEITGHLENKGYTVRKNKISWKV